MPVTVQRSKSATALVESHAPHKAGLTIRVLHKSVLQSMSLQSAALRMAALHRTVRQTVVLFMGLWCLAVLAVAGQALAQDAADSSAGGVAAGESANVSALVEQLAPLSAEERAALLGRVTDAQARGLLLHYLDETAPAASSGGSESASVSTIETLKHTATEIGLNLRQVTAQADTLAGEYERTMEQTLGIAVGGGGVLYVIGVLALLCVVGGIAEFLVRHALRAIRKANAAGPAITMRDRLARTGTWLAIEVSAIAAFAGGYVATFFAFWEGNAARRDFALAILIAILITRGSVALTRFVFAPQRPDWRIMPFDSEAAAHFVRGTRRLAILGTVLLFSSVLGRMWGVNYDTWRLEALLAGLVFTIAALVFLWRYQGHARRAVAAAIGDDEVPQWAGGAAGWLWHITAVLYVVLSFVVGVISLLLDRSFDPVAMTAGFLILFVGYPYLNALIGGLVAPLPEPGGTIVGALPEQGSAVVAPQERTLIEELGDSDDEGAEHAAISAAAVRAADRRILQADRRVLRRIVSIATFVASLALYAAVVGIDLFGQTGNNPVATFIMRILLDVGLVALVAYAVWSFATAWIDRKLAEEHARLPKEEHDDVGPSMQGGTRLQTTLPLVRKALAVTIIVLALLVSLDALGVNIVPLIAGAGVIGLAIGFGSQTLVKDVISGLFFLMDDAFRIGEYIEFGDVGGTVERFNIRSIVLRGYLGAVYTVPYGSIGKVTNYSRDWVIMKLSFRIPYDTDLDKVRKIFKKIGEDMLADPDLGPNFLQPFKSQGAVKMDDSAFIVRGKFMTKPNKQFAVRKAIYERVQKAFREHGIDFAPKRVIVDVPHGGRGDEEAIAGQPRPAPSPVALAGAAAIAADGKS